MKEATTEKESFILSDTSERENTELITRKEIDDTPFVVIGTERGYFVSLGEFRLSDTYETEEEAVTDAWDMTWNRIVQVIMVLMDKQKNVEQIINDIKKVDNAD